MFQPHTFSRTERMLYRMGDSFDHADQVIVTDIFAAREVDDGSVSSAELVAASPTPLSATLLYLCECADYLAAHTQAGDIVITLGAGDGYKAYEILLAKLQADEGRLSGAIAAAQRIMTTNTEFAVDNNIENEGHQIDFRLWRHTASAPSGKSAWRRIRRSRSAGRRVLRTVSTTAQFTALVRWAQSVRLPYFVLGGGSNILISDAGVRGLVIYNRCRAIEQPIAAADGAGVSVSAESGGAGGLARRTAPGAFRLGMGRQRAGHGGRLRRRQRWRPRQRGQRQPDCSPGNRR